MSHPQEIRVRVSRLAALAVAVLLPLTGCAAGESHAPVTTASYIEPRPEGASALPPASAAAATASPAQTCNPLASLRPPSVLPAPGRMPAGSTMQKIIERGRLVVGTDQSINLFSSRDPATGQIVGFDVDVAREVARALFGADGDEHLQIAAIAPDELFPAIQDKRVDLVAHTTTITCERLALAAFSTDYYDAGQRILTSRNSNIMTVRDLDNRTVCAASGTTSIATIARVAPTARIIAAKYWTDCLVMLQQDQAEAITTDDTVLYGLAAQDPALHVVGEQFSPEPYGLVMERSATDFVRFVNGVLARMRADGTWQRLYTKWLPGPAPKPPVAQYSD
ncbi:glutamate ABC transporter substrate-binding protein [Dactylosporangium siamense]|uniref:ABC transporter substrate-binding protein n=1 Tax=Dactylosporangium siamense TaxID=685454 RepID=A0A919Q0J7_9ACTN|nr:glutamate ABC transporter substrate-binding protein [Dactylosporangium siamense]GIG51993.1 ABC transporter substrate-binding protein [Dactylosporangium siamense]